MNKEANAIWWIKQDFRLFDNSQLTHALAENERVVALYIFEPLLLNAPETSAFHVNAWVNALNHLRRRLQAAGGDIIFSGDEAIATFENIQKVFPFARIYSHEETGSNLTFDRDRQVKKWCAANNVEWREYRQRGVFRPLRDRDKRAALWKAHTLGDLYEEPSNSELAKLKIGKELKNFLYPAKKLVSLSDYKVKLAPEISENLQIVSEERAWEDFDSFLSDRGIDYSGGISSPNTAFTAGSRLSVHLAWGTLTVRTAYQKTQNRIAELKESGKPEAKKWRKSLQAFLSRLHWHDHFSQRLESETEMEFRALNPAFEQLEYDDDEELFNAWYYGKSGFPLSDAVMRCLHRTGFANFRMRAMVTSVACHTLHLSWKKIMYPLARVFADYYPGIHIPQVQMQAGVVGINTLRMYNPAKQIFDNDRECTFIKEWIPELRNVEPKRIIAHQENPIAEYFAPVVDRKESQQRMREKYFAIKRLPETKEITKAVFEKHGSRKFNGRRTPKAASKRAASEDFANPILKNS